MKSEQQTVRVWVNGSVYSPADPFATAVLLDGATVAWVGSDDAARAMAGADVTPGDLRAAVVTPAFVAHHRVDGPRELPRAEHGYGAVELLSSDPDALDAATRGYSVALVERRAAPVALACALLIAIKGLAWLLVLRHHRARLRRARLRW